jgi:hypothetical protein
MFAISKTTQSLVFKEEINFKIIYRNNYINFNEMEREKISTIKELKEQLIYYFKKKFKTDIFFENICLSKKFIVLKDEEKIKSLENKIIILSIIPITCKEH